MPMSSAELFEEALKSEKIAKSCLEAGETNPALFFFRDRDWFLAEAAEMEATEQDHMIGAYDE